MNEAMNYEADLRIDAEALDAEWLGQPALFFRYAKALAHAEATYDRAKERADIVEAELDGKVRKAPEAYGLEKITEGAVKNVIILRPEYREAVAERIQRKEDVGVIKAGVEAFNHRKSALENEVRLHGQNYFSGPTVPHNLPEMQKRLEEEGRRQVRNKVNEKLNSSRRRTE